MVEGEKERIMRRSFAIFAVLAIVAAFGATACGGSDEEKTTPQGTTQGTTSGAVSLEQDDFYFQPTTLSGEAGKPLQVALKNEGKTSHTFTIDSLNIDQTVKPDETMTVTVTPKAGGDLPFYCRFHKASNGMQGTITVSGGGGGTSPAATNGASSGASSPSPTKSTSG